MTRPSAYSAPVGCEHSPLCGEGDPAAQLVFVAQGNSEPAADELLEKMITAMGLSRAQVYLCRTRECGSCNSSLLGSLQPRIVVALGDLACKALSGSDLPRGRFHDYRGVKLMPTFDPAQLLRNPGSKKEAWEDLKKVASELGIKTK